MRWRPGSYESHVRCNWNLNTWNQCSSRPLWQFSAEHGLRSLDVSLSAILTRSFNMAHQVNLKVCQTMAREATRSVRTPEGAPATETPQDDSAPKSAGRIVMELPSAGPAQRRYFIVDSGAAWNLLCRRHLSASEPSTIRLADISAGMQTANRILLTPEIVDVYVKELNTILTFQCFIIERFCWWLPFWISS